MILNIKSMIESILISIPARGHICFENNYHQVISMIAPQLVYEIL